VRLQIIDPKANFSCGSCTKCCNQPWATVIEEEKAKALDPALFSAYPQLAGKTFYRKSKEVAAGHFVLSKKEGSNYCLFLDDDGLCIIHKELGPEAKPHPCLKFPYHASTTFVDDRVSVDFGCPGAQRSEGTPLVDQQEDLQTLLPLSKSPAMSDVRVPLTATSEISHDQYDALMDRIDAIFAAPGEGNLWSSFAETLTLLSAVESQVLAEDSGLLDHLLSSEPLQDEVAAPQIFPYASAPGAPSPVRMLFAATLLRDVLPLGVTMNMSIWRRIMMLPKLMTLAKLSGSYDSKLLGHEVCVEDVFSHELNAELDPEATALLVRYFRTRLWQRFLVGTKLSIVAGVHQHIQDFNAIIFLARAEAQHQGKSSISLELIGKTLSCVEMAIANQPRVFDQQALAWFSGQLDSPTIALQSLRLMALPNAEVATSADLALASAAVE